MAIETNLQNLLCDLKLA